MVIAEFESHYAGSSDVLNNLIFYTSNRFRELNEVFPKVIYFVTILFYLC